jgi:hypothetical protein
VTVKVSESEKEQGRVERRRHENNINVNNKEFSYFSHGVTLSPLATAATNWWPILPAPDDR